LAVAAQLNGPAALAFDPAGNLFIAQLSDSRVRMVNTSGVITTVAGTGANGYLGEGLPAVASQLAGPTGVAADGKGNVFISVAGNRVMQVFPNGTMSTLVGNGVPGYNDGLATTGLVNIPAGLAIDSSGNIYLADSANNAVRMLSSVKAVQ
jgi:sugar lactone lactonase YvrE